MSPRILRYHHVTQNISRANVGAIRRFYCDLLGLEEVSSAQQDPTGQRLIWLSIGDRQLHLVIGDKPDMSSTRHIAVVVDDVGGMVTKLERDGVRLEECEPGQFWGRRPNGQKYAFCYDPDGNRIELMEMP